MSIFRSLILNTTNSSVEDLSSRLNREELDLNPACQRGSVWGHDRQVNLIRSLTMGLPIGGITINERPFPAWPAVIDGKQRLEAIHAWLNGKVTVPAEWFPTELLTDPDKQTITFADLTSNGQRSWKNAAGVAVYWSRLDGTPQEVDAAEQELFNLINYGGVPQGQQD